jgi:hypothetical protein
MIGQFPAAQAIFAVVLYLHRVPVLSLVIIVSERGSIIAKVFGDGLIA